MQSITRQLLGSFTKGHTQRCSALLKEGIAPNGQISSLQSSGGGGGSEGVRSGDGCVAMQKQRPPGRDKGVLNGPQSVRVQGRNCKSPLEKVGRGIVIEEAGVGTSSDTVASTNKIDAVGEVASSSRSRFFACGSRVSGQ